MVEDIVEAVGNLMDTSDEYLKMAEDNSQSASRIIQVLQQQLLSVPVTINTTFREVHLNIAVEIRRVPESTLLSGLGFVSGRSLEEGFGNSSLMVIDPEEHEMNIGYRDSEMTDAILMLPPEVSILARGM